jgi:hypothetical protein
MERTSLLVYTGGRVSQARPYRDRVSEAVFPATYSSNRMLTRRSRGRPATDVTDSRFKLAYSGRSKLGVAGVRGFEPATSSSRTPRSSRRKPCLRWPARIWMKPNVLDRAVVAVLRCCTDLRVRRFGQTLRAPVRRFLVGWRRQLSGVNPVVRPTRIAVRPIPRSIRSAPGLVDARG